MRVEELGLSDAVTSTTEKKTRPVSADALKKREARAAAETETAEMLEFRKLTEQMQALVGRTATVYDNLGTQQGVVRNVHANGEMVLSFANGDTTVITFGKPVDTSVCCSQHEPHPIMAGLDMEKSHWIAGVSGPLQVGGYE